MYDGEGLVEPQFNRQSFTSGVLIVVRFFWFLKDRHQTDGTARRFCEPENKEQTNIEVVTVTVSSELPRNTSQRRPPEFASINFHLQLRRNWVTLSRQLLR